MEKKQKNLIQVFILIIISIMVLNIAFFSFYNSLLNINSFQESNSISINNERELYFNTAYPKNNIEWEIKSTCPVTLEIISDFDYIKMNNFPNLIDNPNYPDWVTEINIIRLFTNCYENSGIIELDEGGFYHFLFDSNGSGEIEYTIKYDSTYFDFIWVFYGFLIFFGIIGVISLNIKTPKKSMIEYELKSDSDLQYISYCSYCGNESENNSKNNTDNKFCLYCGTSKYKNIKHPSTIKVKFCERCGNKIKEDLTICQKCEYMMNIDLLFNKIN